MPLRVPQNQTVNSKYTIGKEYIFALSYKEYQGYYYELNNKFFAGKEFNANAPELIKYDSDKINKLKQNPATKAYGDISSADISKNKELKSVPINSLSSGLFYFAKKINSNPVKIIAISEEDYINNINTNPLYVFTIVECSQEWGFAVTEQNLKDIPELPYVIGEYVLIDDSTLSQE